MNILKKVFYFFADLTVLFPYFSQALVIFLIQNITLLLATNNIFLNVDSKTNYYHHGTPTLSIVFLGAQYLQNKKYFSKLKKRWQREILCYLLPFLASLPLINIKGFLMNIGVGDNNFIFWYILDTFIIFFIPILTVLFPRHFKNQS